MSSEPLRICSLDASRAHGGLPYLKRGDEIVADYIHGAELARLFAAAPNLLAAVDLALRWLSTPDKPVDMFEDIADWFYSDTHTLRPGKDDVRGFHSDEERQVAFDAWAKAKGAEIRGALRGAASKARGQ